MTANHTATCAPSHQPSQPSKNAHNQPMMVRIEAASLNALPGAEFCAHCFAGAILGCMGSYDLILARSADARRIAVMSRELIEAGLHPSWPEARVAAHIRDKASMVLVARTGWEIAGFAIMQFGDERAHLNLLAVAP